MFKIVSYQPEYEDAVMRLIKREGDYWAVYWAEPNASRYKTSLGQSITYVALAGRDVCGYLRCIKDALYIYVCDLLVDKQYRGNGLGKALMHTLQLDYPDYAVYVMSGSDGYYEKIGAKKEGSIYLLK